MEAETHFQPARLLVYYWSFICFISITVVLLNLCAIIIFDLVTSSLNFPTFLILLVINLHNGRWYIICNQLVLILVEKSYKKIVFYKISSHTSFHPLVLIE